MHSTPCVAVTVLAADVAVAVVVRVNTTSVVVGALAELQTLLPVPVIVSGVVHP